MLITAGLHIVAAATSRAHTVETFATLHCLATPRTHIKVLAHPTLANRPWIHTHTRTSAHHPSIMTTSNHQIITREADNTQTTSMSPASVDRSPLFGLPRELRDMIYEYTFCSSTAIRITKQAGIPEPALLLTCKIIRDEAIASFYSPGRLILIMDSYDPAVMLLWDSKSLCLARDHNLRGVTPRYQRHGPRDWNNLKRSLQLHHDVVLRSRIEGRAPGSDRYTEEKAFIGALLDVAFRMRCQTWEVVEGVLDKLRLGLIKLHNEWAA